MRSIVPMFRKDADELEDILKADEVRDKFMKCHGHEMYDAIAAIVSHDEHAEVEHLVEQLEAIVKRYIFDANQY